MSWVTPHRKTPSPGDRLGPLASCAIVAGNLAPSDASFRAPGRGGHGPRFWRPRHRRPHTSCSVRHIGDGSARGAHAWTDERTRARGVARGQAARHGVVNRSRALACCGQGSGSRGGPGRADATPSSLERVAPSARPVATRGPAMARSFSAKNEQASRCGGSATGPAGIFSRVVLDHRYILHGCHEMSPPVGRSRHVQAGKSRSFFVFRSCLWGHKSCSVIS